MTRLNSDCQSAITTINTKIGSKDHIVIFGDSWTTQGSSILSTQASIAFPGCTVHNYGVSGARFNNSSNTYMTQITTFYNDSSFDHKQIKFILLNGGVNDYRHNIAYSDMITYLKSFHDTLVSKLPSGYTNVPIYFAHDYSAEHDSTTTPSTKFEPQFNYWRQVYFGITCGLRCINTFGFLDKWNTENYFHPASDSGFKTWFQNIFRVINGVQPQLYSIYECTGKVNDSSITDSNYYNFILRADLNDSCVNVRLYVACGTAFSVPHNTTITFDWKIFTNRNHGLNRTYLGAGTELRNVDDNNLKFYVDNTELRTAENWSTSKVGFLEKCISLDIID